MGDEIVRSIEILKEIPLTGEGDTLVNRLRNVTLRGFPDVKIYESAKFELVRLSGEDIETKLHTPQLRVYRDHIKRVASLATLFREKGIDILDLDRGYDFLAVSESGEETEWTMIPPIVERFSIPSTSDGKLDYESILGNELKIFLKEQRLWLNPDAVSMPHSSSNGEYDLLNDGSHRIHYGFEQGGITVLRISEVTPGFPYYAVPQKYDVRVFETREEALEQKETKIHIVQDPAHKSLYRVFPSGGIKSGNVRSGKHI